MSGQVPGGDLGDGNDLTRVEAHVRDCLRGQVLDFRLLMDGDRLVLRGRAPSFYLKQLAQQAVMQLLPLRLLVNEIEVLPIAVGERNDVW